MSDHIGAFSGGQVEQSMSHDVICGHCGKISIYCTQYLDRKHIRQIYKYVCLGSEAYKFRQHTRIFNVCVQHILFCLWDDGRR